MLSETGLTLSKYALLSELNRSGVMQMTEASHRLFVSKPALSTLARRLEKERLIRRRANPRDHRSFILQLLPAGKKKTLRAQSRILQHVSRCLADMKAADLETLRKFHRRLMDLPLDAAEKTRE
jgi:DNA-binding MarR family transcriptional regulator